MNAYEHYQKVLDDILGLGVCKVPQWKNDANPVIGQLQRAGFPLFPEAMRNRLKRLADWYPKDNSNRKILIELCQNLATPTNWSGAYCELVAADFFNHKGIDGHFSDPIQLGQKLPASRTWASSFPKRKEADVDGLFQQLSGVYFEVKTLQDTANVFLQRLVQECRHQHREVFDIVVEKPAHLGRELDDTIRRSILTELEAAVNARLSSFESKVVPGVRFHVLRQPPYSLQFSTWIEPYQMAEVDHVSTFKYADKFTKDSPFVLVYVQPIWSDSRKFEIRDLDKQYFRSFARRVFCQYRLSQLRRKDLNPKVLTDETLFEVSQSLSAIVFLVDHSDRPADPAAVNVTPFWYTNPNAKNKLSLAFMEYLWNWKARDFDNFEHDNS